MKGDPEHRIIIISGLFHFKHPATSLPEFDINGVALPASLNDIDTRPYNPLPGQDSFTLAIYRGLASGRSY